MHLSLFFRKALIAVLLLSGISGVLSAQVKILSVDPAATDASIITVHGPHIAAYDLGVRSRHLMILMIVGTGAKASDARRMDSIFALMGYHAVSIDYKNNVITVVCEHSKDSACYDHFREEIVTGAPVSSLVEVDSANSIISRFRELLLYLAKNDPAGGWQEFMHNGEPRWDKVITAGHSQGAGHAAYLGKLFRVSRVLMFSGPQDYFDDLHEPAGWQSAKGATPPGRYFAFLNLKDPFDIRHQLADCGQLMQQPKPDTLMVQPGAPIHGRYHILVNNIPTSNPHGSTIRPEFYNVWEYMLGINEKRQ